MTVLPKRFLVSLVDRNLKGFDHGGGFADNDGSGTTARGAAKGTDNGPAPPVPNPKHNYEITVKAYDENEKAVGIGRTEKVFLYFDKK